MASLLILVDTFWNQCQLCKDKIVDLNKVSGLCTRNRETDWSGPTHKVYFKHLVHLEKPIDKLSMKFKLETFMRIASSHRGAFPWFSKLCCRIDSRFDYWSMVPLTIPRSMWKKDFPYDLNLPVLGWLGKTFASRQTWLGSGSKITYASDSTLRITLLSTPT